MTYLFAGASSRIAIEAAKILTQEGHRVVGISTKDEVPGYDALYTVVNYESGAYPELEEVIDGLAYFPGTINLKPFARLAVTDFMKDYEVNVLGGVEFVQSYLSNLKKSAAGSIVFMSSVAAQTGMPFHSSIGMAKAALEGLTKSLAAELAPGIRVNAVAPSLTNTPLSERLLASAEKTEAMEKRNPMKKIGSPFEVAEAITFLLSTKSSWITGQVLAVDGGMGALKL
jgi:3-oxoacyl-[acyl-carrier protein] reductase